jgi:hypothetical protein
VKENLFVLNSEQESQGAITHPFRKMREKDGAPGGCIALDPQDVVVVYGQATQISLPRFSNYSSDPFRDVLAYETPTRGYLAIKASNHGSRFFDHWLDTAYVSLPMWKSSSGPT